MDTSAYLNQHKDLAHLIRMDADCLEYYRDSLFSLPSSSAPRSPGHASPCEDALYTGTVAEIDRRQAELMRKKELMGRLEKQIMDALDQMCLMNDRNAKDYVLFLRHRYLRHEKWEDVAAAVHVSRATVYRWGKSALALFPMPANPIDIRKELSALKAA